MAMLSVPQAAERLGVSAARVRQRIDAKSLIAEKIGGRWLVDLDASSPPAPQRGRPVSPASVWWSLLSADVAQSLPRETSGLDEVPFLARMQAADAILAAQQDAFRAHDPLLGDHFIEFKTLSPSSRHRVVRRFASAVQDNDHDAIMAWLRNRADRKVYRVAERDQEALRRDDKILLAGVSHPDSQMEDLRMVEGYVRDTDWAHLVEEHWLEELKVGDRPNAILHVAPLRPSVVSPLLLAADLAEHGGPREMNRANELLDEAIRALVSPKHHKESGEDNPVSESWQ